MDAAFAWVGNFVDWLGQWIPRKRVLDTTEGAIIYKGFLFPRWLRVKLGPEWMPRLLRAFDGDMQVIVCEAGVHYYWPGHSNFFEYPTARQTDRLESQVLESSDGKTFLVSATITYEVEDLTKLAPKTHSPLTLVVDTAMTVVHDVCCKLDWADLQNMQRRGTIKTELRNAAHKELSEYGIRVHKLKLNTLARCRVLKVSQSTASEEN